MSYRKHALETIVKWWVFNFFFRYWFRFKVIQWSLQLIKFQAVLGAQLVITLVTVSVIQKLSPYYSFARWMLCSTGWVINFLFISNVMQKYDGVRIYVIFSDSYGTCILPTASFERWWKYRRKVKKTLVKMTMGNQALISFSFRKILISMLVLRNDFSKCLYLTNTVINYNENTYSWKASKLSLKISDFCGTSTIFSG